MSYYLIQTAYTPQGWEAMVKNPHNRLEAIKPVVEGLGGSITNAWMQFGDYDVMVVVDMPDNLSAAALSMAASAGGAVKAAKTTPLMTIDESVEALRKASGAEYNPPESEFPYYGT